MLEAWRKSLADSAITVSLPKFEVRLSSQLNEALVALGMPRAFDMGAADFSGMKGPKAPKLRLYISAVVHEAFLKIDEAGAEAAAATAVIVTEADSAGPPQFRADRPFLFLLMDTAKGDVLFIGRVMDPR